MLLFVSFVEGGQGAVSECVGFVPYPLQMCKHDLNMIFLLLSGQYIAEVGSNLVNNDLKTCKHVNFLSQIL